MLRRLRPTSVAGLSAVELSMVDALARRHASLLWHSETLNGVEVRVYDVISDPGFSSCEKFLRTLEAVSDTLQAEIVCRDYREGFSTNYRAIFPNSRRHYRADVLEVSMDRHSSIWVNGEKFELSAEAADRAAWLQLALATLGSVLDRWHAAMGDDGRHTHPSRSELLTALSALDVAWAAFEERYITDLISIEDRARQLIHRAVEAERQLGALGALGELPPGQRPRYRELQDALVRCVSQLNAVANFRRKGRDDLTADVLDSAQAAVASAQARGGTLARMLGGDVLSAFQALRSYLQQVQACIERVDPHLCKNKGLVACLVDWEESWELAGRYIHNRPVFEALSSVVDKIEAMQVAVPRLAELCRDCDVELFMALPRTVLLCFLSDQTGSQGNLLRLFLPDRFHTGVSCTAKPEIQWLQGHYQMAVAALARMAHDSGDRARSGVPPSRFAWEAMVRRAVGGTEAEVLAGLPATARGEAQAVLEAFFRRLEPWSLELQRHCPEDWNQCSSVLVQCLTGESKRPRPGKFQV